MKRDELLSALRGRTGRIRGAYLAFGREPVDCDFLVLRNSWRLPDAEAAGMMPFGDANGIVLADAKEAFARAGGKPLLAGVCGTDPMRMIPKFLEQVRDAGFSGVVNTPSLGLVGGVFRAALEETKLSYRREVEMIAEAAKLGLATAALAFTREEAALMAGADLLVCHLGIATDGPVGRRSLRTPAEAAEEVDAMAAAAGSGPIVLAAGGPLGAEEEFFRASKSARGLIS